MSRLVFVLAGGIWASSVLGVDRSEVNRIVLPYIESGAVKGIAVALIDKEGHVVAGYGQAKADKPASPDGDTVFEIGSVSKVFTGILLADAIVQKQVRTNQPISELLPDGVLPRSEENPILVRHLATHTSGLPRLPTNIAPKDPSNPYADYGEAELFDCLRSEGPSAEPDEEMEYSNLAVGMLGHLLARRVGASYQQLIHARIVKPLQLTSTSVSPSDEMLERMATPHRGDGSITNNWDFDALAGAGAVRSTANDMLKFLNANLDPPEGHIGEALKLAMKMHAGPKAPEEFAMCLGWHIARDGTTRWHNGQTGGFHCIVLVNRTLHIGVAVLCNTATFEVDRLGNDMVRLLAGETVAVRKFVEREEIKVDPELVERYVGTYRLLPGFNIDVTNPDGQLHLQATGQPKVPLFAKSEKEWFLKVVEAEITFQVDEGGTCNALVLFQNGQKLTAKRINGDR